MEFFRSSRSRHIWLEVGPYWPRRWKDRTTLRAGLVDELSLDLHPGVVGTGTPLVVAAPSKFFYMKDQVLREFHTSRPMFQLTLSR